jgi:RNA polymerase sigma factor (sigma-70 family)
MKRRRAASRREDRLLELQQAVGVSTADSAMLALMQRSVQQARKVTGDADLSEDLAAKALAPLFQKLNANPALLEDAASLEKERFYRTASRIYKYLNREKATLRRHEELAIHLNISQPEFEEPDCGLRDPRLKELEQWFSLLPEDQRQAVLLIRGHGMKPSEASQVLGVPIGALKMRVSRALKQLRANFGVTIKKQAAPAAVEEIV